MTTRYYAHFVTDNPEPRLAGEYSGVVELAEHHPVDLVDRQPDAVVGHAALR